MSELKEYTTLPYESKQIKVFSKACEYGIKASIYIAGKSKKGERASLRAVAKAIDSPIAYTGKILQLLAKHNVIKSVKGAQGGYEIRNETTRKVSLEHVVNAIDGKAFYQGCALGLKKCDASKPCPLHFQFVKIRNEMKHMLEKTELNELTDASFYLARKDH